MSLTYDTARTLAESFRSIAEHELDVEGARIALTELSYFSPFESFQRIDRFSTGDIHRDDIIAFCADNGVACSDHDAARVIEQYDENHTGRLNFHEYCQLVLSVTSPSLRSVAQSRDTTVRGPRRTLLDSNTEFELSRVFAREIDYQRALDGFRRELSLRADWTLAGGFDIIDMRAPRGRIDRIEIGDFMRAHGQPVTEDGLDAIIRRTDTDEDEALSFDEFADVFRDTAYVAPVEVVKPYPTFYDKYYPRYSTSAYRATRSPV